MKISVSAGRQVLHFFVLFTTLVTACSSNPYLEEKEGYVEVSGGKIWYRILGEGEEVPLVYIHGGPGGTSFSAYLLAEVSKDRPMILYDQLGGGKSDHHNDTSLMKVECFVEQQRELIEGLKLESFYLCGSSWGTLLALEYYLKYPEGVEGIIFSSPVFSEETWSRDADTLISLLPDFIQAAIEEAEIEGNFDTPDYKEAEKVFYSHYMLRSSTSPGIDTTLHAEYVPGSEEIYEYMWGPSEFTATGTLKGYNMVHRLNEIQVPVLFVTGEYDEARPSTVRYFRSLVPGSEFEIIEDAGHATMYEDPEQCVQVMRDFLNGIEGR